MSTEAARAPTIRAQSSSTRALSGWVTPLVVVAALTLIALVLRASQIHQSLEGDEVFTYQDIFKHSFTSVLSTVHTGGENSPPLFFLMAWFTAKLGDPSVWIRLPSIVFGSLTVPAVYILGRMTVGRMAGMVAAGIIALSPFAVFYGVEARPYATMTFFVVAATVFVIKAVRERRVVFWGGYVVCAVAAAYCHYTCIFLLIAQGVWALWVCRDNLRIPLIAQVVAAVLYVPWLPYLRGKDLTVIGTLLPLNVSTVLTDLLRVLPGFPSVSPRQIPTLTGLVLVAVCALLGTVAYFVRRGSAEARADNQLSGEHARQPGGIGLLTLLALATPVGLLIYSLLATDLWLPRGLSASLPAASLVLGALLVSLPRPAAAICVLTTLAVLAFGTAKSFTTPYARENYRAMAAYLDRSARPQDQVLMDSLPAAPAIPEMAEKQHPYVPAGDQMFHDIPANSRAFLVLDETLAKIIHIGVPRPPHFQIDAIRRFPGSSPTEIITYSHSS